MFCLCLQTVNQQLGPTDRAAKLNVVSVSHRKSFFQASADDGEQMITFTTPTKRCNFRAELRLQKDDDDGGKLLDRMIFVDQRSDGATFRIRFPEKGFYSVRIFGRESPTGNENPAEFALVYEYVVDVDRPTAKFGTFPRQFPAWTEGFQLVRPTDLVGVLPADSLIPFEVILPGAHLVKVIRSDDREVPLTNGNSAVGSANSELWSADVQTGNEGELTLKALFEGSSEHVLLLAFQVTLYIA